MKITKFAWKIEYETNKSWMFHYCEGLGRLIMQRTISAKESSIDKQSLE